MIIFEPTDCEENERKIFEALRGLKPNCPAPDMLLALEQGVLPGNVALSIAAHLRSCRVCNRLASDLGQLPLSERRVFRQSSTQGRSMRYAAIAACLALAALVAGYRKQPTSSQVPSPPQAIVAPPAYQLALRKAPLKLPLSSALVVRGEGGSPSSKYLRALGHALVPYRADDFVEATRRLESLAERYPTSVEPVFYLGVSRLMLEDPAMALETLREARRIGGTALADDILWYLAITHERLGTFSEARPMLEHLCSNESPHKQSACDALGK